MKIRNRKAIIILIVSICFIIISIVYSYSDIIFMYDLNRAIYYSKEEEYDKSLEIYNKLLETEPNLYELHFNKAVILANIGDKILAIEELERAKNIKDDDPDLYYNLYILYEDIDKTKAYDYINKAKSLGFNEEEK